MENLKQLGITAASLFTRAALIQGNFPLQLLEHAVRGCVSDEDYTKVIEGLAHTGASAGINPQDMQEIINHLFKVFQEVRSERILA